MVPFEEPPLRWAKAPHPASAIPAGVAEGVRPERGVRPAIRAAWGRCAGRDRMCNLCSRTGGCLARRRTGCRTRSSVVCGDVAASGGAGRRATPCWGRWRQGFTPPRNRYEEPARSTNTWSCDEPQAAQSLRSLAWVFSLSSRVRMECFDYSQKTRWCRNAIVSVLLCLGG